MSLLIITHVIAGTVAFLSGVIALFATKGSKLHRKAGQVFVGSMVITGGGGAVYALQIPQAITVIAGIFTVYLVVSSYATLQRTPGRVGLFEVLSALLVTGLVAASVCFGLEAQAHPSGLKDGFGAEPYFFFATVAAVALMGDLTYFVLRGRNPAHRIARHLWRMGFALYIAAGSLLDGPGTTAFPESLRGTIVLTGPVALIGITVAGWWIVALATRRFRAP